MKRIVLATVLLTIAGVSVASRTARSHPAACCASVNAQITRDGERYVFSLTNKAEKAVIAFTFTWNGGDKRYSTFLFGSPFNPGTYQESAMLNRNANDSPIELASVAFDDGSYEGDESIGKWNLTAIRAAQAANRDLVTRLNAVTAGEVSVDTALDVMSASTADKVRRERVSTPDEIAADWGVHEAMGLHRAALERAHSALEAKEKRVMVLSRLKAEGEILERRFNLLRKEAQ